MQTKIIVGYDESDRGEDALALGRWLASIMDGRLILAGVVHSDPLVIHFDPCFEEVDPEATERVERAAAAVGGEAAMIVSGSPARGLHDLAEERDANLIVVGSSHRGRVGRVLAGGTGQRLLHGSSCPVAVAPIGFHERTSSGLQSIVVGYDGSPEAEIALERAVEIAKAAGARVRIAMAVEDPPLVYGKGGGASQGYLELKAAILEELQSQLQKAVAAFNDKGVEVSGKLLSGEPPVKLAEVASDADLLVVGSRGYGPLRCVLLGSVSARLVGSSSCPVMVVPRGAHQAASAAETPRAAAAAS